MPRKMKESGVEWLGQIPEGWEVCRVKDSFAYQKGLNITKADLVDRGIFVISYGQIHSKTNTGTYIGDGLLRFVPESFLESNAECLLKKNDFVFADTSEDLDGLGNCAFCDRDDVIFAGYHTIVLRPTQTQEWKYCAYLFKTDAWRSQFRSLAFGIKVFSLSQRLLNVCTFVLPPLPEQQRIAAFLDERCAKIDGMIAEAKASIEDYKKWKQSIIFEAVTGKHEKNLKPSGVDWIGDVPEGWKVCAMKTAIDILPGYAFESEAFAISEGIRLLRGVNVSVDSLRWDETVYWNASVDDKLAEYLIKGNDLIVGLDRPWISGGTRAVLAKESDLPCLLVQRVCRIRAKECQDIRFLLYLLKQEGFEKELSVETTGVSVPHISTKQIENFKVPLPSVNVQRRIAAELDEKCAAIDKLVGEKEALIADLEAYKKSLIFETVTGKREVA